MQGFLERVQSMRERESDGVVDSEDVGNSSEFDAEYGMNSIGLRNTV